MQDKGHAKNIEKALKPRGLKFYKNEDWEIHGPHEGMNYQVYVGGVYREADPKAKCVCSSKKTRLIYCDAHKQESYVVIRPNAVYQIEDPSDWWKPKAEDRILRQ